MPTLTVEIPEIVARRLEALASVSGKSLQELARDGLDAFTSSFTSRRTILKARRDAAASTGATCSLADLGWLEGYAGQRVDELLLFEGTEGLHPILSSLEQAIQEKEEKQGSEQITGVERIVLSVMALLGEVNNGGYDQFFRNASRRFAPSIAGNLVRIGCPEIADITRRAVNALHLPEMSAAALEAAMQEEDTERDAALEACSAELQQNSTLMEKRLLAFVRKNQAGIRT